MKKFMNEFKKFISRGNVMDMAVGIIIGGAFTSIVSSLVDDIINPILGIFGGMNFNQLSVEIPTIQGGTAVLSYGNFITAVINFLIMALIVFLIMKALNALNAASAKLSHKNGEQKDSAPTEKECPYCKSKIVIAAVRCPHCTSMLEEQ